MAAHAHSKPLNKKMIGQLIEGEGIYLGQYKPKNHGIKNLKVTFNIFAAPTDLLPKCMTYDAIVKHIAQLKNWHGHDGTNYASDTNLYKALENGSYNGGWIIPTSDMLHGKGQIGGYYGEDATPDSLWAHKDVGAFKGAFNRLGWYLSSTPFHTYEDKVWRAALSMDWRLLDGAHKKEQPGYCRPVRLVARP